jgi:hypothetical protein
MVKKLAVVVLAVLLSVSFGAMAFAQQEGRGPSEIFMQKMGAAKSMSFEGTVVSHDVSCHCMVIKTAKGTLTLQDDYVKFMQDYNKAQGLKIGSKVKGTYKTVDYINYAQDIAYE